MPQKNRAGGGIYLVHFISDFISDLEFKKGVLKCMSNYRRYLGIQHTKQELLNFPIPVVDSLQLGF